MYRAAIVGCGRIASGFDDDPKRKTTIATHAGAYCTNANIELVAAADISADKVAEFGKKWGVASEHLFTDYQQLLVQEKIDILSICTWNTTHLSICKDAVRAGIKAIFCEKPIAENLLQADEMIDFCKQNNVLLAINHSRRWDKMHQEIKRFLDEGKIGKIQQVSAYYTAGIANTGTHLIDLLLYLFGPVEWVTGNLPIGYAGDPNPDAYLFFKKGFGATLAGLDVKQYLIFEIDIYGSTGRIRIENSGFSASYWRVIDHPQFSGYKCIGERELAFTSGLSSPLVNAVQDLVDCLDDRQRQLVSSGEDGRAALEVICAIIESSKQAQGVRMTLPMHKRDTVLTAK